MTDKSPSGRGEDARRNEFKFGDKVTDWITHKHYIFIKVSSKKSDKILKAWCCDETGTIYEIGLIRLTRCWSTRGHKLCKK